MPDRKTTRLLTAGECDVLRSALIASSEEVHPGILVNEEGWQQLQAALEEEPKVILELRKLFEEHHGK